jgi:hypothetical protein
MSKRHRHLTDREAGRGAIPERDFYMDFRDAWLEVANLYNFLKARHEDGSLTVSSGSWEQVLKEVRKIRDILDQWVFPPIGEVT